MKTFSSGWPRVLALVAVLVMVRWLFSKRSTPKPRATRPPAVTATPAASPRALLPLAVGNRWVYREARSNGRGGLERNEVTWFVGGETRDGLRVTESRNGRSTNTFILVGGDRGVQYYEFESQARPLLLLPTRIATGDRWPMSDVLRAKAVRRVEREVAGRSVLCYEIRFERFYGTDWTDDPGWFDDGTIWVAEGIGIIGKDLTHALRPPSRDRTKPKETWGPIGAEWWLESYELK
jgi:hypothetical protein